MRGLGFRAPGVPGFRGLGGLGLGVYDFEPQGVLRKFCCGLVKELCFKSFLLWGFQVEQENDHPDYDGDWDLINFGNPG